MLLNCAEYVSRWDELYSLFSPGAIQKGSLDRYVESSKVKKGTATVDNAFLAEISRWRELLARNIALRNPRPSTRELNFAVQRTIAATDRQIDELAYELYGLNDDEIRVVEGGSK